MRSIAGSRHPLPSPAASRRAASPAPRCPRWCGVRPRTRSAAATRLAAAAWPAGGIDQYVPVLFVAHQRSPSGRSPGPRHRAAARGGRPGVARDRSGMVRATVGCDPARPARTAGCGRSGRRRRPSSSRAPEMPPKSRLARSAARRLPRSRGRRTSPELRRRAAAPPVISAGSPRQRAPQRHSRPASTSASYGRDRDAQSHSKSKRPASIARRAALVVRKGWIGVSCAG